MYFSYSEIRSYLLENWEQLSESAYPEDLLREWGDNAVPVYYNEIISDWQEMPSEFDNAWQEIADSDWIATASITQLMAVDLCEYYQTQFTEIYNKIKEELEESELENA
jgi:uncharacterized protein YecA (UPF0149 family)